MKRGKKPSTGLLLEESGPVHVQVRRKLKDRIAKMNVGDRLPPVRALSKHFNVALVTVHRAMGDLEKGGFVIRQQGRGTFVGKANHSPIAKDQAARTIGMLMPGQDIPHHASLIQGAREEATRQGFDLAVRIYGGEEPMNRQVLSELTKEPLAGLIIYPFSGAGLDESYAQTIRRIQAEGKKVIMITEYLPTCRTPVVVHDDVRIGYIATEHLIMLGHRRIAYVSTGGYDLTGNNHLKGYRMALADYGISSDQSLIVCHPIHWSAEPAQRSVEEILTANPQAFTAVASPQFSMTFGILNALKKLNLKCPQDIAVVGGNMYQNPELNYVTHTLQQDQRMGEEAVKLLVEDKDRGLKRHVLLKPELIIGTTCGARTIVNC